MQIPPITELQEAAKRVVWDAKKKGTLMELTPRLVRHMIETQLGLDDGSLDASKYKSAIKDATAAAVNQDPPSEDKDTQKSSAKVNKKRKSNVKHEEDDLPTPKSKGKSRAIASKDKEDEGSIKKKRKTAKTKKIESEDEEEASNDSEEASPRTTKKKRAKRKDTKQFKSLEHVPTSDMEQDEPGDIHIAGPSIKKPVTPKKAEPPLQVKLESSKSSIESKPTDNQRPEVSDVVMGGTIGRDLSSELTEPTSDEPEPEPKPKVKAVKKEPKTTKTRKKEKEKKGAKSSTTLNKDEETIKRLKLLVSACGVRKIWAKVFQDLDSPNQQIKKLKEILAELGMAGSLSMDHAKMIKRKRELAQELADVQQFERAFLSKSSRTRTRTSGTAAVVEEDDDKETRSDDADEDEDEAGSAPKRRPTDARKSINAFLQDQSDEE